MASVKGKTALVIGAESGIGLCFAQALLAKGWNVLIADLALRPEAQKTLDEYSTGSSPRAIFKQCDVSDWSHLSSALAAAEDHFQQPFSNFWIPPGMPESRDVVEDSRYKVVDIDITHPIRLTQLALQHFTSNERSGNIVHITSSAGQAFFLLTPMYVATKHAITGFVRSLADLEPKFNIRVTAIAPGIVRTPLWRDNPEKTRLIDEGNDEWVTSEEVATAMVSLIEKEEHIGHTVPEVGHGHTRVVPLFMDPGPSGPGYTMKKARISIDDVWEQLQQKTRVK